MSGSGDVKPRPGIEVQMSARDREHLARQFDSAFKMNRRALEALAASPAFDALRESTRNTTALAQALKASAERQSAMWDRWRAVSETIKRATDSLDRQQWTQLAESMSSFEAAIATSRAIGLAQVVEIEPPGLAHERGMGTVEVDVVSELEAELPDGLAAVPFIVARLSPARRRECILRLIWLLVTTWVYIEALRAGQGELPAGAAAVVANFWLYASVLSAIEDVESELDDRNDC